MFTVGECCIEKIIYGRMTNEAVTVTSPHLDGDQHALVIYKSGPVTLRHLTDTEDDRQFVGSMMVAAFEQKLVHATSRGRYVCV